MLRLYAAMIVVYVTYGLTIRRQRRNRGWGCGADVGGGGRRVVAGPRITKGHGDNTASPRFNGHPVDGYSERAVTLASGRGMPFVVLYWGGWLTGLIVRMARR